MRNDFSFEFEAIGTHWSIDVYSSPNSLAADGLLEKIKERIEVFDKDYSRFRTDSLVTKMSTTPGVYKLPEDARVLFDFYRKLYDLTGGHFSPFVGNTLSDMGYDKDYNLDKDSQFITKPIEWDEGLEYKYPEVLVKKPSILDFGAAGKGYLVDIVSKLIMESGFSNFCVDAGGDIYYQNEEEKAIRVGLENPKNFGEVIGVSEFSTGSICSSSGSRRVWGKYHHIINPKTLEPTSDVLAVWVYSKCALWSDGIATCLFFVEPDVLSSEFEFEYLILYPDFSTKSSTNFPAELYYNNSDGRQR